MLITATHHADISQKFYKLIKILQTSEQSSHTPGHSHQMHAEPPVHCTGVRDGTRK